MVFRPLLKAALLIALSASLPQAAHAKMPKPAFMPAGAIADAPNGFLEMCARNRDLCLTGQVNAPTPEPAPVTMPALVTADAQRLNGATGAMQATASVFSPTARFSPVRYDMWTAVLPFGLPPISPWVMQVATPAPEAQAAPAAPPAPLISSLGNHSPKAIQKLLKAYNSQVNRAVTQMTDFDATGRGEYWDRLSRGPNPVGDCEDIAIEKRLRLTQAGFPAERMFYAVAFIPNYGLHTVLVVRLDDADYVLDSMTPYVLPWSKVHYVWLRQQKPGQPMVWSRIGGDSGAPTYASGEGAGTTELAS